MGLFRRKKKAPEPITVEQAIAQGLIPQPKYVPKAGFYIRHWTVAQHEFGQRILTGDAVDVYYPSWATWRTNMRSVYMGGRSIFGYRDLPTGIREPMIDLGPGVTDEEYQAARGFLLDKGLVTGPDNYGVFER